jgi:hypothetical protein
VRQANRLFTNYKEGWKTDTGMYYILYGRPSSVSTVGTYPIFPGQEKKAGVGLEISWTYDSPTGGWINDGFIQIQHPDERFPFKQIMFIGCRIDNNDCWIRSKAKKVQQQRWRTGNLRRSKF